MERGRKRGCRGKNAAIFQTSPLPSPSPNEFILAVFFGRWRGAGGEERLHAILARTRIVGVSREQSR
jgi:hypothetical protein